MMTISGKRVVVTGGAGFIGSHLCDELVASNPSKLVVIDDFSLGKPENISGLAGSPVVTVYRRDATDFQAMRRILEKERAQVVFNLAVVPLPKSLTYPKQTIDTNVLISTTFSELLRRGLYDTLIHCSSSEAYGSAQYVPMDEAHPEVPITPYAASKLAADHVVMSYCKTFGLDASIVRPFNSYGPRQNHLSYAGVVPITIRRILANQRPVIFGDGSQTRDYTYVKDIVSGIISAYERKGSRGRIINVASGREISIKRLVKTIMDVAGVDEEPILRPPRPGDVARHLADISLAKKVLGYSPKVGFSAGLRATFEWYRGMLSERRKGSRTRPRPEPRHRPNGPD